MSSSIAASLVRAGVVPSSSNAGARSASIKRGSSIVNAKANFNGGRRAMLAGRAPSALAEDQQAFTAERLCGMNRNMIQHIFSEIDENGNGLIEVEELDFLAEYLGETWTVEDKKALMDEVDADGSGAIDGEEFYNWFITHCKADDENQVLKRREERLNLGLDDVPQDMLDLLVKFGTDQIKQECTHPLHSGHGRMLRDHLVSTYLILKQWGAPDHVVKAGMFHALYERADGMRAVDFSETQPMIKEALGDDVEELMFYFPSAHKTIYSPEGLLHSPLGGDFPAINFADKQPITIPNRVRKDLAELEFVNGYDQSHLDCNDRVRNMWAFYQHANIMPLLSKEAQRVCMQYFEFGFGATCEDIVRFHEGRFKDFGKEVPEKWADHALMFKPGGKYHTLEQRMNEVFNKVDISGDGNIDDDEMDVLCAELGITTEEDRAQVRAEMDRDGDGTVDRKEFVLWFVPRFNQLVLGAQEHVQAGSSAAAVEQQAEVVSSAAA